jgi:hypothetical protein
MMGIFIQNLVSGFFPIPDPVAQALDPGPRIHNTGSQATFDIIPGTFI